MLLRRRGGVDDGLPTHFDEDKVKRRWASSTRSYAFPAALVLVFVIVVYVIFWDFKFGVPFVSNVVNKIKHTPVTKSVLPKNNPSRVNHKSFVPPQKSQISSTSKISSNSQNDLGNIVVLSYQVHPGASAFVQIIAETYDLTNAKAIFSRRYWDDGMRLPPEESSVTDGFSALSLSNQEKLKNYIAARLARPDGYRRKIVEIEITDAWSNGVTLAWLIAALRDHGSVTHLIKLSRNPVHMEISAEALKHFGRHMDGYMPHDTLCDAQRNLYEISTQRVVDQAVAMGRGFAQAAVLNTLPQVGFSYEADVARDLDGVMRRVGAFLGSTPQAASQNQQTALPRSCQLSQLLHNYADLHCELGGSPLHWMVQDSDEGLIAPLNVAAQQSSKKQPLSFEEAVGSAHAYSVSWLRDGRHAEALSRCAKQRSKEELVPVDAVVGRCAHGGHTEVCRGHGRVSEFVCRKIFENSGCTVMTYRDSSQGGDCYLHQSSQDDYWVGDCTPPDYHATLLKK